ncbi:MAG TPA: ATP-binding protein, partial [Geobacteraceae bacterium]|nr:ATP-binding protein [Geobacteraceae bacterium]
RFALRGSKSRYRFRIMEGLWPVEADEGQISQVISNIAINADQAMPEGGEVTVNVENIALGRGQIVSLQPGRYIRITLTDNGTGITAEHLPKIFTPYFSTKPKGSGLGLATSYSIINKHGGAIMVDSRVGSGTTFNIYLPASGKDIPKKEEASGADLTGSGRVLVMDDEESVLDIAGEILAHAGYRVEHAKDGEEAIDMYVKAGESGEPFAAVILDLTIPGGMGGKETVRKLLEIAPEAKAIVSSGYAQGPIMADFREHGFRGMIAKPYQAAELCRVVKEVMNGAEE